jgi:hypothetical protein
MKLRILDTARDDLVDGCHFHEKREPGLDYYFLTCLYSDIEALKIFGGIHAKPYRHFHRALSKVSRLQATTRRERLRVDPSHSGLPEESFLDSQASQSHLLTLAELGEARGVYAASPPAR